jgi:hypothetical protein
MFLISPSESFLLGISFGEFLRLRELRQEVTFQECVKRRLGKFVPDMVCKTAVEISEDEVPDTVEWQMGDNGVEWPIVDIDNFGELLFVFRQNGKLFREVSVKRSRNLLDLLAEHMACHGGGKTEEPHPASKGAPPKKNESNTGRAEDPQDIARPLALLVDQYSLKDTFSLGKCVGTAFGNCVAAEKFLIYLFSQVFKYWNYEAECLVEDGIDLTPPVIAHANDDREQVSVLDADPLDYDSDWCSQLRVCWKQFAGSLTKEPAFAKCMHSDSLARDRLRNGFFELRGFDETGGGGVVAYMISFRANLCLIVGEILGLLHDRDVEFWSKDASQLSPRDFQVSPSASSERIGGALKAAELAFSDRLGSKIPAEVLIRNLRHCVEAQSRELWPEYPSRGRISQLLKDKKYNSTSPHERRFASVAKQLYEEYGNPAEHDPQFSCSRSEAKFFFTGIHALYDLAKQIKVERGAGSG